LAAHEEIALSLAVAFQKPAKLTSMFHISSATLLRFIRSIETQYQDQPYHNWRHAWDVLQMTHLALFKDGAADRYFKQLDVLALLVSSIAHDVAHPGVTNQYLCRTMADLAIEYNDRSVLENMHAATLFRTMRHGGGAPPDKTQDILERLTAPQFNKFREMSIHGILGTDMSGHFKMVDEARAAAMMVKEKQSQAGVAESEVYAMDTKLALTAVLHFADISAATRPFKVFYDSTLLIEAEFFAQGDLERAAGVSVSPMMDREKDKALIKSQNGWINFVVAPLLTSVKILLPVIGPPLEEQMMENHKAIAEINEADNS